MGAAADSVLLASAPRWPHAQAYAQEEIPDVQGVRWLHEQLRAIFDCLPADAP